MLHVNLMQCHNAMNRKFIERYGITFLHNLLERVLNCWKMLRLG